MYKFFKVLIRMCYIKKITSKNTRICRKCGKIIYKNEKCFAVKRWNHLMQILKTSYCTACMKTRKDVLNEVDNDNHPFGIAFVDDSEKIAKK